MSWWEIVNLDCNRTPHFILLFSHNNATFILQQLKIKASGDFILSCCYKKICAFFQTALLYLKVISNIVGGNTYSERSIKMTSNQITKLYTTQSVKLCAEVVLRTSLKKKRISVFGGLSINEYYITKIASTTQHGDDTKGRNINYMSWIE